MNLHSRIGVFLGVVALLSSASSWITLTIASGTIASAQPDAVLVAVAAPSAATALAAWLLARRWLTAFLQPLDVLTAQVKGFANEEFEQTTQPAQEELAPLSRAINVAAERLTELASTRRAAIEELRTEINSDPLTRLGSRQLFMSRLAELVQQPAIDGAVVGAVALLRVNDLAAVNRSLGRQRTDELIRAIAAILITRRPQIAPAEAVLARLNGADFGILVSGGDADDVSTWLRSIATAVNGLQATFLPDADFVAWLGATPVDSMETTSAVLARADAMLQSAEASRTPFRLAESTVAFATYRAASNWTDLIDDALNSDRVTAVYFPVVDRSGRATHVEAHVRMQLPDGTIVAGRDVVPPAIRSMRIIDVDLRMVQLALMRLASASALSRLPVSVNVSPASIERPSFLVRLRALLERFPQAAPSLVLEVSETVLDDERFDGLANLGSLLRSFGASVGIDHLLSRLHLLPRVAGLPVKFVKIDARACRGVTRTGALLPQMMASMAKSLGATAVALGQCSNDEVALLAEAGIDGWAQPPASLGELVE